MAPAKLMWRPAQVFALHCRRGVQLSVISARSPTWTAWTAWTATNMIKVNMMERMTKDFLFVPSATLLGRIAGVIEFAQARDNMEKIRKTVLMTMNGLRLPHEDLHWSLQLPKHGWNTAPHIGPHSNVTAISAGLRPRDFRWVWKIKV